MFKKRVGQPPAPKAMDKDVSMLRTALLLLSVGFHAMNMAAAVKVEKTEYRGWANCYRVSNGEIEVIVTRYAAQVSGLNNPSF
jgi:hypothetical protein